MFPLMSSFTAASSGPQGSSRRATADMIWPEVQYPHWYPSWAKSRLHRMQRIRSSQPFDGSDLFPIKQERQRKARNDTPAVHMHSARAALPMIAALFRSGERNRFTNAIEQRCSRIYPQWMLFTVNAQCDGDGALTGRIPPCSLGPALAGRAGCMRRGTRSHYARSHRAARRQKKLTASWVGHAG